MSTTPPPPPPPEDPFLPPNHDDGTGFDADATLDQGRPSVAASPGRVMLVLGVVGAILLFLLYNIFSSGEEEQKEPPKPNVEVVADTNTPPPLPNIPEQPPALPQDFVAPPVPEPMTFGKLTPEDDAAEKERQQARLRSSIMVDSGGGGGISGALGGNNDSREMSSNDPNMQFGAAVAKANTKAPRVTASYIGNLHRTIAQGKIIQATLESALNTELPAPIRAIVSRDIYGEAGLKPLIPKGSRLIGQYNTSLLGGQSRVYVVWTRVIRPDGVDVMINSPLVDQIGQAGLGGQVDSKFQQIFSRAVLASIVTIGIAYGSDEITGGGESSTTNSSFGGTTQSGDGATMATVNALNRLGGTTDNFMQRYLNLSPSILVDQGTAVNVFVNQDLVFPSEFTGGRVLD